MFGVEASEICGPQYMQLFVYLMSSDHKEAGLSLCGRSVLVLVAAISRVVALIGQADVTVFVSDTGTATLVELATNWLKGFSILRRCKI